MSATGTFQTSTSGFTYLYTFQTTPSLMGMQCL
jgi:hypothetical protein